MNYDCRKIWLVSDNPDCNSIEICTEDYLHTFGEVIGCTQTLGYNLL
ncbi:MAG: hypothetical protein FWG70_09825 [Oscillospiraceae bacterium]|nr:hypothetical protein [Oscillospiraceae bacterium]